MAVPRLTPPSRVAALLLLLAPLLVASLAGCGGGGGSEPARDAAITRAEQDATRKEAEAQRLRERLRRLRAERAQDAAGTTTSAAAAAVGAAAGGAILPAAAHASFDALARTLPGEVGIAVSPVGAGQPVEQLGSLQSAVAWSTSKVPVAMAAIEAGVGSAADLRAAITASDNAAATNLWNALGGGASAAAAADAQLRAAGDEATAVEARTLRPGYTPFGQTRWALADQVRFTAGMACLAAGGQVLGLMHETIATQRWGLGATGVPAELKGGWGPGSEPGAGGGYLDRQMGVVTIGGHPLAVTLMARPGDGAHETGTSMLTRLAAWVVANADVGALPRVASC